MKKCINVDVLIKKFIEMSSFFNTLRRVEHDGALGLNLLETFEKLLYGVHSSTF